MCEPITAALGSMSAMEIVGTAVSVFSKLAEMQARDDAAAAAKRNADQAYNAQMSQLQLQRNQENQQVGEQMSERAKQAQAAEARLRVSAGESGISGVSVDRIGNDIARDKVQDMATLENNRESYMMQTTAEGQSIAATRQSRINAANEKASGGLIGVGLQIGSSILDGATRADYRIARQGLGSKVG